jgi:hypothetical protein
MLISCALDMRGQEARSIFFFIIIRLRRFETQLSFYRALAWDGVEPPRRQGCAHAPLPLGLHARPRHGAYMME